MTKERAIELATEFLGKGAARVDLLRARFEEATATWIVDFVDRNDGWATIICVNSETGKCIEMDILQD